MSKSELSEFLDNPKHHAFLLIGDREKNYAEIKLALREKVNKKEISSSDIWSQAFENLNIDDARAIKEVQNTKPVGNKRFVVVSLSAIQNEAQNSLLKLFEEPTSDTVFIICAPTTEIFLPTVLSRLYIAGRGVKGESNDLENFVHSFLASSVSQRMTAMEPFIKEKNKNHIERFLNALESILYRRGFLKEQGNTSVFEEIFAARRFLRSRSPSLKMIVENLIGIIPPNLKVR